MIIADALSRAHLSDVMYGKISQKKNYSCVRINWDSYKIDDITYIHSPIEVNSLFLGFQLITKIKG